MVCINGTTSVRPSAPSSGFHVESLPLNAAQCGRYGTASPVMPGFAGQCGTKIGVQIPQPLNRNTVETTASDSGKMLHPESCKARTAGFADHCRPKQRVRLCLPSANRILSGSCRHVSSSYSALAEMRVNHFPVLALEILSAEKQVARNKMEGARIARKVNRTGIKLGNSSGASQKFVSVALLPAI